MTNKIYDVAIVGGGPAGISTAIYAVRAGLSVALINDKFLLGGTLLDTASIENYPGFDNVSGSGLAANMEEHLYSYEHTRIIDRVEHISLKPGEYRKLKLKSIGTIKAKTVVIATGVRYKKMNIPGEDKYSGKGISSCATCDGFFFRGTDVAVIGGGDSAVESAIELSDIVKSVTVVHRRDELRAEQILINRLNNKDNISYIWNADVNEFCGDGGLLQSIKYLDKDTNEQKELLVKGSFVNIGIVPNTEMVQSFDLVNADGYIRTVGSGVVTRHDGIFAVGDARENSEKQVVNAVADGSIVVREIKSYLERIAQ